MGLLPRLPAIQPLAAGPRIILVAGGYRSGSTLQYNLIGEYLEHAGLGRRLGYVQPNIAEEVVESWISEEGGIGVAKCHQLARRGFTISVDGGSLGRARRARRGRRFLTTSRRQRDVERSMCRKFNLDPATLHAYFEWRENLANAARWREFGPLEQEFDELTRHPVNALRTAARTLRIPWSIRPAARASLRTRRRAMIRHQEGIPRGTCHPVTLMHWDHIAG